MEALRETPCVVCGARVLSARGHRVFTCSAYCRAFIRKAEAEQLRRGEPARVQARARRG